MRLGRRRVFRLASIVNRPSPLANSGAFSLIEVLVAMTLLAVIILGLVAMFDQTQRAFRLGMTQTDILESGRIATDMLARELAQTTPCDVSRNASIFNSPPYGAPNFFVNPVAVSLQAMTGANGVSRTNVLTDLFFLQRQNQTWTGIGYFVRTNNPANPSLPAGIGSVGTLYRFEMTNSASRFLQNPGGMFSNYVNILFGSYPSGGSSAHVSKVLDGVVTFSVHPLDTAGWIIPKNPAWWVHPIWSLNSTSSLPSMILSTNLIWSSTPLAAESGEIGTYYFYSNAVPAAVEVELGILEQRALEQYQSIPIQQARDNFLRDQAGHLHVFRQRIAIRNVDPSAYQ